MVSRRDFVKVLGGLWGPKTVESSPDESSEIVAVPPYWDYWDDRPRAQFLRSRARFPALVTNDHFTREMLYWKIEELSANYPDNFGVVVCPDYRGAQQVAKDFGAIHGASGANRRTFWCPNGSSVMFLSADSHLLRPCTNLNLGWFGIDQAHEFPDSRVFDVLRVRLRRDLAPGQVHQGFVVSGYPPPDWMTRDWNWGGNWEEKFPIWRE